MSFRNRLALFFVVIVIAPMLTAAILLDSLISEGVGGRLDAAANARHDVARRLFVEQRRLARRTLKNEIADHEAFLRELQAGRFARAERRARRLLKARSIKRIVFVKGRSEVVFSVGDRDAVAPAGSPLRVGPRDGPVLGRLELSVVDAQRYAREVRRVTGLHVIVRNANKELANTFSSFVSPRLPAKVSLVSIEDSEYRVVSFGDTQGFAGQGVRVFTLSPRERAAAGELRAKRITGGAILLGFFIVAIACAALVWRSLQQQIYGFLAVARKLVSGDFSGDLGVQAQTVGHDEFAALGMEFNKMSQELERRLEELRQERVRVQDSMRRLGEAVASNLDRDALLKLVVRAAVDGIGADAGRACVRATGRQTLQERTRVGDMDGFEVAIETVEADALRTGAMREVSIGTFNAIAHPLRGAAGGDDILGVVSIGRAGRLFTPSDRDLLHYLAGQATRSMENVDLHETAARESVTDGLTGLANRRALDGALASEVERFKRFGTSFGLVLIDLDDFKAINDTYGHQQGDVILREVARVLRETSREIDIAARYGGEELAVVLPGTDLEGAFNLAERIRERIAGLRVRTLDGTGVIALTTSCGVAAMPITAGDARTLVAAADAALYEAKRAGKNKSLRAR